MVATSYETNNTICETNTTQNKTTQHEINIETLLYQCLMLVGC